MSAPSGLSHVRPDLRASQVPSYWFVLRAVREPVRFVFAARSVDPSYICAHPSLRQAVEECDPSVWTQCESEDDAVFAVYVARGSLRTGAPFSLRPSALATLSPDDPRLTFFAYYGVDYRRAYRIMAGVPVDPLRTVSEVVLTSEREYFAGAMPILGPATLPSPGDVVDSDGRIDAGLPSPFHPGNGVFGLADELPPPMRLDDEVPDEPLPPPYVGSSPGED